ncbi:dinuclear metal center YbgI/SA1388 family protein [Glaciihabitans tibetensis]|uniref:GTP cyclohydrolase 1 type 2 homolog n=1 Tax=Glaciihabitans tibetensis TaxID=1266600 RepID=A0A2T0VAJ2_9MICO|nr:Nif3-like dinuclear metal center hexameric protein [Glaciihabitans tibetensis]PRY67088.1 dinuclear metal center YbgI/SA1388 family protein [Glaciihabitans tibetensis]
MSPTVAEVNAVAQSLWPLEGAESWDAPGLLSGDPDAPVTHIHLAVDAVLDTVDEALQIGADLLLVHHPLLLRGVTSVAEDRYKGAALARLIRAGCGLIAAHTNADVVETGTSAVLADRLNLVDAVPIVPGAIPTRGIGRAGTLAEPTTLGRLARELATILPPTAAGIRVSGDYDAPISTVALCGGAGDSLLGARAVMDADVYITSDLRHHPASESRENARLGGGPALIDVSHWASEWLWLDTAASQLREALDGVTVTVSDLRTDPWDFVVVQ